MSRLETDVLVTGGGMAGLAAATAAQQRGVQTILLRKGQSATSMSSGGVDVLGYLPGDLMPLESPIDGLLGLAAMYPRHPYVLLGINGEGDSVNARAIEEPIDWLRKITGSPEFKLIGDPKRNRLSMCVLGSSKPTCLVQDTMDQGIPRTSEEADVLLFVGFSGHADFNPRAAARSCTSTQMYYDSIPRRVADCVIDVAPFGNPFNVSSIELARHMDHQNGMDQFIAQTTKAIERTGATRVVIPPVLGLKQPRSNMRTIVKELGIGVSELLSFPPSVPGLRLQNALENAYLSAGGKLMLGFEASSPVMDGHLIDRVTAKGPRRDVVIDAKSVVLASGKFIGSGLAADETGVRETSMGLMAVTGDYYPASGIRPAHYSSPYAIDVDGHPLFSCGIAVDSQMRPIDADGNFRSGNLFAAGSVLAGYDYMSEKSGLGVALATGYAAGMNAAGFSQGGD